MATLDEYQKSHCTPGRLSRGSIVWAEDRFKEQSTPRPWLIISNGKHPYAGKEYMALPLTTNNAKGRIRISDEQLEAGDLRSVSYVSPWAQSPLQGRDCEEVIAYVTDKLLERIRERFLLYTQ